MAEETDLDVKPKRSKLPLIIIIAVVVLLGGGAAAYFLLFSGSDEPVALENPDGAAATQSAPDPGAGATVGDAVYVAMPRPFVFHVPGIKRDRTVQIKVQLLVRGSDAETSVKKNIPLVEATLLQSFSSATAEGLATSSGKEALRVKSLDDLRAALSKMTGQPLVEQVLFTGFVMQ